MTQYKDTTNKADEPQRKTMSKAGEIIHAIAIALLLVIVLLFITHCQPQQATYDYSSPMTIRHSNTQA